MSVGSISTDQRTFFESVKDSVVLMIWRTSLCRSDRFSEVTMSNCRYRPAFFSMRAGIGPNRLTFLRTCAFVRMDSRNDLAVVDAFARSFLEKEVGKLLFVPGADLSRIQNSLPERVFPSGGVWQKPSGW